MANMVYGQITFGDFCERCIHRDKTCYEDPCVVCINTYVNLSKNVPVNYEADVNKIKEMGNIDLPGMW